MANWRRAWWPGGTWFFTVNLLERRNNRLLVEQIDLLRHSVTKVQQAHPFAIHAWVVCPTISTAFSLCRKGTPISHCVGG
ncbi:hypothetical protein WP2S18C03_00910 [Aeromonas veronii]|nr:hypothetical protein WP2S18C03_00910 [Aeromonas veronii]